MVQERVSEVVTAGRLVMSLAPPEKVGKLREALHAKAKAAPNYRFYLLYDKIYRADVLAWAYERCLENDGAAGVDGQTFVSIERYGREQWLGELAEELRKRTYQPQAVRRGWILKADGSPRPLGIPTVTFGKDFATRSTLKETWTLVPFICDGHRIFVQLVLTDSARITHRASHSRVLVEAGG